MINLIMIGAQGSGKGTQSQVLARELQLRPCASGELLRTAIEERSPLGEQARPYVDRGDLVPDELVIGLILHGLDQLDDAAGVILDGFPRNIPQARKLDERLGQMGQPISAAICLEVPREMLLDRLSGRYLCRAHGHVWNLKTHPPREQGICDFDGSALYQRSDDTSAKIAHRLDIFFSETIQLVSYYEAQAKLIHVDGTGSAEAVTATILGALRARGVAPVHELQ